MPLVARPSQSYQAPLRLEPLTSLELVAQVDGVVTNLSVKPGDKISAQSEAVRLESTERQLELDRAKAVYRAAQLEQAAASAQAAELATAKLDVAKFELQLAQHRLDQTMIRAPFTGTITRVHVVPGQFVRTGQPLVTHTKAGNTIRETQVEHYGHLMEGYFYELVDRAADEVDAGTYEDMYYQLSENFVLATSRMSLPDAYREFFNEMGGKMIRWSRLFQQAPVHEVAPARSAVAPVG